MTHSDRPGSGGGLTLCGMTETVTRVLTEADEPLLWSATLENLNWAQTRFTMRDVVDRGEFAHYAQLVVARGDFGFVAERDDRPVGVVWVLFLPAEDAGYGFVGDHTPELSLWVDAEERGRGVGRYLLRLAKTEARRRGIAAVSLSVESRNFAKNLYQDEGFRPVHGRDRDGVMIWAAGDH